MEIPQSSSKLKIVYGFFNQYLFSEVKMNIDMVKSYFTKDPLTQRNTLLQSLLNIIANNDFKNITESTFRIALEEDRKTPQEIEEIISQIITCKHYTKEQIIPFRDHLKKMCYSAKIADASYHYSDDPVKYVESIKGIDYKSNYADLMSIKKLGEVDITDIYTEFNQDGLKSAYNVINNSYPLGFIPSKQVIMVVGAPGTGKSAFLMSEANAFINQGAECHYLAMGDLNEMDFFIRMSAMRFQDSLDNVTLNIMKYKDQLVAEIGDKLLLTIVSSGKITSNQYVDYMMSNAPGAKVYFADYDSNFLKDEDASMYDIGGVVYDNLTELSRSGKLVYAASQPKQYFWDHELLPLEAAGESSRKQHIVDMIITLGRSPNSATRCGYINVPKNRRGKVGMNTPYIADYTGKLFECSNLLYSSIMGNKSPQYLSPKDLAMMETTERLKADKAQ